MPKIKITNTFSRTAKCPQGKQKIIYSDTVDIGLLLEVRSNREKTFYYRYTLDNKQKLISIADAKIMNANKARSIVQKLNKNKKLSKCVCINSKLNQSQVITLGKFYHEYYVPHIKTSKKSYRQDMNFYKNHILSIWKDIPMDNITRAIINKKHSSLVQDNKLSPNTANKLIKYLSHTYNLALNWEIDGIKENPTSKIKLFAVTNIIERFLTKEETISILNEASKINTPYIKSIIEFLMLTGARKQEVLTAQWKYIDLKNKLWTIPLTKSGKVRRVPITPQLEKIIEYIPKNSEIYLFPSNYTGEPMKNFEHHWYKIRKEVGLDDLRIHDLRHSFASVLVNSGRSLYEVQHLLGHSNVSVTQRYAHLTQNSLYEAACMASKLIE